MKQHVQEIDGKVLNRMAVADGGKTVQELTEEELAYNG